MYKTSLFKREKICNLKDLSSSLEERISQIIDIVNYFSEMYRIPESEYQQLILESIIYSYERKGNQCPKTETELRDLIKKINKEINKETTCCFF
jgi:hypothetical protein